MGGMAMAEDAEWEAVGCFKDEHSSTTRSSSSSSSSSGSPKDVTLVLVGRTGNGKSATGNSILGGQFFPSKPRSCAVTCTSELKSVLRPDGRLISVVDTPGLFDPSAPPGFINQEILKCIDLARDGVHGILLVLSIRNRFTPEEISAVENLEAIFGDKVVNYMALVFTNADDLEDGESLEDYLSQEAPEFLKNFIARCGNRKVLFDNKTKEKQQKELQLSQLLDIVDNILAANNGEPYSNELFHEAQERLKEMNKGNTLESIEARLTELQEAYKSVPAMVDEKVQPYEQNVVLLTQKLVNSEQQIEDLKEQLMRQRQEIEREIEREFKKKYNTSRCAIL